MTVTDGIKHDAINIARGPPSFIMKYSVGVFHTVRKMNVQKLHTCEDAQLCSFIYYTDVFRSLLRPSSGCPTVRIQAVR